MRLIDADAIPYTMLYKENWLEGTGHEAQAVWKKDIDAMQTIEERKTGTWTTEEVAELLFNMFGEECACNFNGIDEWLPERCKYAETTCPEPKEKHGCWMQFLLQGGADMRGEEDDL